MQQDPIVIVGMARTPIGNLLGALKDFSAPQLGSHAIKTALTRANVQPDAINEVLMGCVLPAGLGQAPARQAALGANIPPAIPCTTLNKVCGSGMKTVMLAHDLICAGSADIVVAGGMESMTNAPYLLPKARQGYRFGHGQLLDHMALDGLEDAYDKGKAMGVFADQMAAEYGFTREAQDQFAIASFERAKKATADKAFADIAPITLKTKHGEQLIEQDEHPFSVNPEKIPTLNAAFTKEGTVTAGNASSIADGAAALVLMRESEAKKRGIKPIARILAHSSFARLPSEFTIAPVGALQAVLKKVNWTVAEVDLFEINEAFAMVTMAAMKDLAIPHEKVNILGGGIALGHPIGASGARIITTLISALMASNKKRGIASLCIGGGEATAIAIERC